MIRPSRLGWKMDCAAWHRGVVCRRPEGPPVLGAALMGLDIVSASPASFARLRADAAELGG